MIINICLLIHTSHQINTNLIKIMLVDNHHNIINSSTNQCQLTNNSSKDNQTKMHREIYLQVICKL